jgi:Protein of unknown function (DUF3147)
MLDYLLRFIAGGIAVSAFAALGDAIRPRTFAGVFGAAPSIALATILIALSAQGAHFVAIEARSMVLGALAMAVYSWATRLLIRKFQMSSLAETMTALVVWSAAAFGATAVLIGVT